MSVSSSWARTLIIAVFLAPLVFAAGDKEDSSPSHRRMSSEQEAMIAKAQGIATNVVAYRNVDLFAGTAEDVLAENVTIVVDGDRIATIVDSNNDAAAISEAAEIIDGTGWYAVPGLIDSHVHLATMPERAEAEAMAKRYLYGGITAVRDMAGDARHLADLSRASIINEIPSPDIYYSALMAGPSFFSDPRTIMSGLGTQPGHVPWMQGIDKDSDLSLAVAMARGTSASGIKIYANLPGEDVQAIIAEGKAQGMLVWAHAEVYPATIFDSIGANAVSHVCMIPESLLRPEGVKPRTKEAMVDLEVFDVKGPEFQRYVTEIAAAGTKFDATAHIFRQRAIAAKVGEETGRPGRPICPFDTVIEPILTELHEAGVQIVAGTDFVTEPGDPFPALIVEMETLADVDALSNADVIRTATANAASMLDMSADLGTVEPGKYANLVFVTDNPLEDIGHLRNLVLTVKRGQQYYRDAYVHEPIPTAEEEDR